MKEFTLHYTRTIREEAFKVALPDPPAGYQWSLYEDREHGDWELSMLTRGDFAESVALYCRGEMKVTQMTSLSAVAAFVQAAEILKDAVSAWRASRPK